MIWEGKLSIDTFGLNLNDFQFCKAGKQNFTNSYFFKSYMKITKVECVIWNNETNIMQMNFYRNLQKLVALGMDDEGVKAFGERVEVFDIADDEQLIGCTLFKDSDSFLGVKWMKMKVSKMLKSIYSEIK